MTVRRLLVVSTLMLLLAAIVGAPPALALDCNAGDPTCQQLQHVSLTFGKWLRPLGRG